MSQDNQRTSFEHITLGFVKVKLKDFGCSVNGYIAAVLNIAYHIDIAENGQHVAIATLRLECGSLNKGYQNN